MNTDNNDFEGFLKQREEASQAYVNGDTVPLNRIATQVSPATIFGPMGNCVEGAKKVNAANSTGAKAFDSGGESHFEIMQSSCDGDIGFWTGIQRARVRMQGKKKAASMDLRVTEIFRREKGGWKLVHRHADPLKTAPKGIKK